jgi:hypothetical protein
MQLKSYLRRAPWLVAAVVASASITACAHPTNYRDDVHNDNHRWDRREDTAYRRWETERHVQHTDFNRRGAEDQRAYWAWRHEHPG